MLKPYIAKVINSENLTREEAEAAMGVIMTGEATPAQVSAYIVALRMKGETIDEITGSVEGMRAAAVKVIVKDRSVPLFDIVGTGGDGAHTFNISTAAAFVLAGAGKKIAKHGNRAASSLCGSADVLSALGFNLEMTPEQVGQAIDELNIGFMFAPKFHPAMKHAIGPRKEIGQRTIFNVLGPLTNPAGADIQLTGVYSPKLVRPIADVLKNLGSRGAMVLIGAAGTDELNTCGTNKVCLLRDGDLVEYDLTPSVFGLRPATIDQLKGGTPDQNADIMRALLSGALKGPIRDSVLLNAAAAISIETSDLKNALEQAANSIESGAALASMQNLVEFSRSFIHEPLE
jgi:anthranilate phosphoribosyltransferase